jgi:3-oxoacyl-(acyl-carrier-protein) synthase
MNKKRVVISEIEAISTVGIGYAAHADMLPSPTTPTTVRSFEFHELEHDIPCFQVHNFEPKEILGRKGLRTKDHATKLLLSSFEPVLKSIVENTPDSDKPGICVGTAFGSVQSIGDFLSDSIVNGVNAVNPQAFANTVINAPAGNANIRYGIQTLSTTVATGFNAGADALCYACNHLRRGYLDWIMVGAVDEVSYYELLGFQRTGVLSKRGNAHPLGTDADGYVAGEASCGVMVETLEHARNRGATIIAEIAAVASGFDPSPGTKGYNPRGDSAKAVIARACSEAGIAPSECGLVAASANGDPHGDAMEAEVLRSTIGDVPVAPYKVKTGECYGASPLLSLCCACADMERNRISGSLQHYPVHDSLNIVTETVNNRSIEHILVNAFSCEGYCAAIVLKKFEQ